MVNLPENKGQQLGKNLQANFAKKHTQGDKIRCFLPEQTSSMIHSYTETNKDTYINLNVFRGLKITQEITIDFFQRKSVNQTSMSIKSTM